jgi:hypothetical protein
VPSTPSARGYRWAGFRLGIRPARAEPPLRLILGSEAYAYAMAAARAPAESDAAWHDLTISTDRDDATAAQRSARRDV